MSADYQALMLLAIVLSLGSEKIVFKPNATMTELYTILGLSSLVFIICGYRYLELPTNQIAVMVLFYTAFAGIYGGLHEVVLKPYMQSRIMRYAYLSHIGIWASLMTWATRWTF